MMARRLTRDQRRRPAENHAHAEDITAVCTLSLAICRVHLRRRVR